MRGQLLKFKCHGCTFPFSAWPIANCELLQLPNTKYQVPRTEQLRTPHAKTIRITKRIHAHKAYVRFQSLYCLRSSLLSACMHIGASGRVFADSANLRLILSSAISAFSAVNPLFGFPITGSQDHPISSAPPCLHRRFADQCGSVQISVISVISGKVWPRSLENASGSYQAPSPPRLQRQQARHKVARGKQGIRPTQHCLRSARKISPTSSGASRAEAESRCFS